MEWITGQGSNEVDIGYVPLMRAFSSASVPWQPDLLSSYEPHQEMFNYSSVIWDYELSMSRAAQEIEKFMYPFKKVDSRLMKLLAAVIVHVYSDQ